LIALKGPLLKKQICLQHIKRISKHIQKYIVVDKKGVTALALDTSGSRLLSGGFDYQLKFWDFNGMTSDLLSFRTLEPVEGHQVMLDCNCVD
jgi:hypothetical protein